MFSTWISWLAPVIGSGLAMALTSIQHLKARQETKRQREERFLLAERRASRAAKTERDTTLRDITKVLNEHDGINARWFAYETDVAQLLDFPMMTDMREQLTVDFHKAMHRAYLLRPEKAEDLLDDRKGFDEYRAAVSVYLSAFEVAEAEAVRRRRSYFTAPEQERMERAQKLLRVAQDEGATSAERQLAYDKAARELQGILVLPRKTMAFIEQRIMLAIES